MLGVPYISPSKRQAKVPTLVSLLPSARRDGKHAATTARKARAAFAAIPAAESPENLRHQFHAVRSRLQAALSGNPVPFDPNVEQLRDYDPNYDSDSGFSPCHSDNSDDREDGYEGDVEPEDTLETHKCSNVEEAVAQVIQSSEDPPNPGKRSHSENKMRLEDAWDNFVVAHTKLLTTTRFPKKSVCQCNRTIRLPVVDFVGEGSFVCKTDDLESSFEDFVICDKDCPFKDAMPGFLQKGCYPSTPLRPKFAFKDGVIKFFARMYFKGPSSKVNFCNTITSFIQEQRLFASNSIGGDQV
jgi:hypothetical protein